MPLITGAASGGGENKSILKLPRWFAATGLQLYNSLTATTSHTVAGFWTTADYYGAWANMNTGIGVYKTLVDITGGGYITSIICNALAGVGEVTIKITVDGVEEILTVYSTANYRAVIGSAYTSTSNIHDSPALTVLSSNNHACKNYSMLWCPVVLYVPAPHAALSENNPLIRFDTSLKIEMMNVTNAHQNDTYNQRAGVLYVID